MNILIEHQNVRVCWQQRAGMPGWVLFLVPSLGGLSPQLAAALYLR